MCVVVDCRSLFLRISWFVVFLLVACNFCLRFLELILHIRELILELIVQPLVQLVVLSQRVDYLLYEGWQWTRGRFGNALPGCRTSSGSYNTNGKRLCASNTCENKPQYLSRYLQRRYTIHCIPSLPLHSCIDGDGIVRVILPRHLSSHLRHIGILLNICAQHSFMVVVYLCIMNVCVWRTFFFFLHMDVLGCFGLSFWHNNKHRNVHMCVQGCVSCCDVLRCCVCSSSVSIVMGSVAGAVSANIQIAFVVHVNVRLL